MEHRSRALFPEGYKKFLYEHQCSARYKHEQSQASLQQKQSTKPDRTPRKPDQDLYIVKGIENNSTAAHDMDQNGEDQAKTPHSNITLQLSSNQGFRLNITWAEVDLDSFVAEARPFIRTTITDVMAVSPRFVKEVCSCIVNRAWQDENYFLTAAKLCTYIAQAEQEAEKDVSLPVHTFLHSVAERVAELADDWSDMRAKGAPYWTRFCQFVAHLYVLLAEFEMRPSTVEQVLLDFIQHLSCQPCRTSADELELMCWMVERCGATLAGSQLGKHASRLEATINTCRDLFLDPTTTALHPGLRHRLLMVIELNSCAWSLPSPVKQFYHPFLHAAS